MTLSPECLGLPPKFKTFSEAQEKTILELSDWPCRFQFLSAPTGAGKSAIAYAAMKMSPGRSLYTVKDKGLQDQLKGDFSQTGLVDIRGHGTYPCARATQYGDFECESERCYYKPRVEAAKESCEVETNFANWVHIKTVDSPHRFGQFNLLVIDEAHSLASTLRDLLSIELVNLLQQLNIDLPAGPLEYQGPSIMSWIGWTTRTVERLAVRLEREQARDPRSRLATRITRLSDQLCRFVESLRSGDKWISKTVAGGIKLCPVWASNFTEQYMFRGIDHILLMSATMSRLTPKYLGVREGDYKWLEVTSSFDSARKPFIFIRSSAKLDRSTSTFSKKKWMAMIDSIIGDRTDRKGVLHTWSYELARYIVENSQFRDMMITHRNGERAKEAVQEFKRSTAPMVLVSPSVSQGYDFPGDECRYIVICKVPFLNTADPLNKLCSELDPMYSFSETAVTITQMAGRGNRSADDWCEIVMVDANWRWVREKDLFAKWFMDTWKEVGRAPQPLYIE